MLKKQHAKVPNPGELFPSYDRSILNILIIPVTDVVKLATKI